MVDITNPNDPINQAAALSPSFINPAYATPDQLSNLRLYADALTRNSQTMPVKSGWQGLGSVANAIMGGIVGRRSDQADQAIQALQQARMEKAYGAMDPTQQQPGTSPQGQTSGPDNINGIAVDRNDMSPSNVMSFVQQDSPRYGVDPRVSVPLFNQESSLNPNTKAGDGGSSFGVPQLHYGGISKSAPNNGMGDEFTAATGKDARDPKNWPEATDFALSRMGQTGLAPWATSRDKLGFGNWTGIGTNASAMTGGPPSQQKQMMLAQALSPNNGQQAMAQLAVSPWTPESTRQQIQGFTTPKPIEGMYGEQGQVSPYQLSQGVRPQMSGVTKGLTVPVQGQAGGASVSTGLIMGKDQNGNVTGTLAVPGANPQQPPPIQPRSGTPPAPVTPTNPVASPSGAPVSPQSATPPQPPPPPDRGGGFGPLISMTEDIARQGAQNTKIAAKAADYTTQYAQAKTDELNAVNTGRDINQLDEIFRRTGGNINTGEGAAELAKGMSLGQMLTGMAGVKLDNADAQSTNTQLLNKYGYAAAAKLAKQLNVNPTNMDIELSRGASPSSELNPETNKHLIFYLKQLNDLAQSQAHEKQTYYESRQNLPADQQLDGFNEHWLHTIGADQRGSNRAVVLSNTPTDQKEFKGQTYGKFTSTDPDGYSWEPIKQ